MPSRAQHQAALVFLMFKGCGFAPDGSFISPAHCIIAVNNQTKLAVPDAIASGAFSENRSVMFILNPHSGSLADLLEQERLPMPAPVPHVPGARDVDTHGTTVIAVKYKDGIINVADRRATAGYSVMYDQAEKVLALDDYTLISISGSFAKSVEVVRYLRHTFKYFERSQLQPMSQEGKLMELQRVIANNVPAALQGIGAFIPVLSTFDRETGLGRIYFYDVLGGQFETAEYGAAGSGSAPIKGAFEYILKTKGPFRDMSREVALQEVLTLLDIAADLDTATGGSSKFLPASKYITADGIHDFTDDEIKTALGRA